MAWGRAQSSTLSLTGSKFASHGSTLVVDDEHLPLAMLKEAIDVFVGRHTCKRFLLGIKVLLDAEHISRELNQAAHIFCGSVATYKISAVIP